LSLLIIKQLLQPWRVEQPSHGVRHFLVDSEQGTTEVGAMFGMCWYRMLVTVKKIEYAN
jgi:hypothetical protein